MIAVGQKATECQQLLHVTAPAEQQELSYYRSVTAGAGVQFSVLLRTTGDAHFLDETFS